MSFGIAGAGVGAGGGGGSAISTTGLVPVPPGTPRLLNAGVGGSALVSPSTDLGFAGGTSDATVPTLGGTCVGSEVLESSSVRVDCVGGLSEFDAGRIVFLITSGATSAGNTGTSVISHSVLCASRCASYA